LSLEFFDSLICRLELALRGGDEVDQAIDGRVALAITRQGSHRSVRAHIRAYGSSTSRFAARKGPRSYSIELRGHGLEPRCVPHVALDRVCWLTLRFPPQGPPG
jgi:hypothetical protein